MKSGLAKTHRRIKSLVGSRMMTTQGIIDEVSGGRFDHRSRELVAGFIRDHMKTVAFTLDGQPLRIVK